MPKVSVIIPTYNRAELIGRAIKSVLNQTYQDFELIVVDDGSTDNTEEVVKGFNDLRIKYIKHEINKGGNVARNTGLKNSKGEYIAFLDSDDEYLPEKLEKQLEVFNKSKDEKLGFVYCGAVFIDEKNKEIGRLAPKERGYVYKEMLADNIAYGGICYLIRKEAFDKCGFFDESDVLRRKGSQDYEMWIKIAQNYTADFAKEYLVNNYFHSGKRISTITSWQDKVEGREYIVHKFIEEYEKFPKILSTKLRRIGTLYCIGGNVRKGRMLFLNSIKYNLLNMNSYICWLISFSGSSFYNKISNFKRVISIKLLKRGF